MSAASPLAPSRRGFGSAPPRGTLDGGARRSPPLTALAALLALGLAALGGCTVRHRYPAKYEKGFVAACTLSATHSGAPTSTADAYCGCMLRRIEQAYTLQEFLAVTNSLRNGTKPPAVIVSAIQACQKAGAGR